MEGIKKGNPLAGRVELELNCRRLLWLLFLSRTDKENVRVEGLYKPSTLRAKKVLHLSIEQHAVQYWVTINWHHKGHYHCSAFTVLVWRERESNERTRLSEISIFLKLHFNEGAEMQLVGAVLCLVFTLFFIFCPCSGQNVCTNLTISTVCHRLYSS